MSNDDLVNFCLGIDAYLEYAEANNFSTKRVVQGLGGCLVALSSTVTRNYQYVEDTNTVVGTMNKLSSILESLVSFNQCIDLAVVGQHNSNQKSSMITSHPDSEEDFQPIVSESLKTGSNDTKLDTDDDWDDYGGFINSHEHRLKGIEKSSGVEPVAASSSE